MSYAAVFFFRLPPLRRAAAFFVARYLMLLRHAISPITPFTLVSAHAAPCYAFAAFDDAAGYAADCRYYADVIFATLIDAGAAFAITIATFSCVFFRCRCRCCRHACCFSLLFITAICAFSLRSLLTFFDIFHDAAAADFAALFTRRAAMPLRLMMP